MAEKIVEAQSLDTVIALFGSFDENAKLLEKELNVRLLNRDSTIKIEGAEQDAARAEKTVLSLINLISKGETLSAQNILYTINMVDEGLAEQIKELSSDAICMTASGKLIKSKTLGQKKYIKEIEKNTVTFGVGPAGTGKTYLAVAMAVKAFRGKEVNRIILTRPAVEAGEKLGFLPGDLQMKVDPYLRPLYDALYDMLGVENYQRYVERGSIEIAPLAYMRGRTLDVAFIILDEAQNTTPEQMKMFLTRIGFGSKAIVTGDITQIDLPGGKKSGLKEAMKILKDIDDISFCNFTEKDVVRHPLVQKIIKAYEIYDSRKEKSEGRDEAFKKKFYARRKETENE